MLCSGPRATQQPDCCPHDMMNGSLLIQPPASKIKVKVLIPENQIEADLTIGLNAKVWEIKQLILKNICGLNSVRQTGSDRQKTDSGQHTAWGDPKVTPQ
eukprot:sb/3478582/